jgi:hypothetical protein
MTVHAASFYGGEAVHRSPSLGDFFSIEPSY